MGYERSVHGHVLKVSAEDDGGNHWRGRVEIFDRNGKYVWTLQTLARHPSERAATSIAEGLGEAYARLQLDRQSQSD